MVAGGESNKEAFARGVTAGEIAEQLRAHETHLGQINGSQERMARALERSNDIQARQTLSIQQIRDQLKADAETRITLASALKEAADKQLKVEDRKFIPWQQVAIIATVIGAVVAIYFQFRG